ncbi:glycosyltransferase [Pseudalkalibacillus hwajinpoensis]|uniref:glycosyltransferase family 2 protein n=1 Tax=Guptibacillus hwajinpoensis TaxID=208199 RepID=UPI00325B225C
MLVSVVMAVYNEESYLIDAINSILHQTYTNFEFIIVNDGSTDNTKRVLDQIIDERVRVIHLDKNQGAANALNKGINEANGNWIAIQDADDLSLPTRLEEQTRYIHQQQEIVAVGALKECISGSESLWNDRLKTEEHGNFLVDSEHLRMYRFYINPLCHGSVLFSKDVFNQVGGYNTSYKICYDYDLWMRMFEIGQIHKLPKVLYQYRVHSGSLSKGNNEFINEDWVVAAKYIKKIIMNKARACEPTCVVLGNKQACKEFKQISNICNLTIARYVNTVESRTTKDIFQQFINKKIDGVIILEGIQFLSTFQRLQDMGMEMNKSLYKIWAGYLND